MRGAGSVYLVGFASTSPLSLRALATLLFLVVALAATLAGTSLLFNTGSHEIDRARVAGLSGTVTIVPATDAAAALIDASTDADFWRALGFAHGSEDAWTPLALRQLGLASVSQWSGADAAGLDLHAASAELERVGHAAYDALEDADRERLGAYADGLDAALRATFDSGALNAIVGMPETWEPWHSVLVAHVVAFAASPLRIDSLVLADSTQDVFAGAHRAFREAAALYSFDGSATYTLADSSYRWNVLRWGIGGSARSPLHLSGQVSDADTTWRVTLMGTPMELAQWSNAGGWAEMPAPSGVSIRRASAADTFQVSSHRIQFADDLEIGFRTGRAPGRRLLTPTDLVLEWNRLDEPASTFTARDVLGAQRSEWSGATVSTSALSDSLRTMLSASADSLGGSGVDGYYRVPPLSGRALAQARVAAARIDTSLLTTDLLRESAAILAGWDGLFDTHSVGATIYDAWLGRPSAQALDTSAFFANARITADFARAVARLARSRTATTEAWRWGDVHQRALHLPLSSSALPAGRSGIVSPGYGYPTALVFQRRTEADSLSSLTTFAVAWRGDGVRVASLRYTPERLFDYERRRYDAPRLRTLSWGPSITLSPSE